MEKALKHILFDIWHATYNFEYTADP